MEKEAVELLSPLVGICLWLNVFVVGESGDLRVATCDLSWRERRLVT